MSNRGAYSSAPPLEDDEQYEVLLRANITNDDGDDPQHDDESIEELFADSALVPLQSYRNASVCKMHTNKPSPEILDGAASLNAPNANRNNASNRKAHNSNPASVTASEQNVEAETEAETDGTTNANVADPLQTHNNISGGQQQQQQQQSQERRKESAESCGNASSGDGGGGNAGGGGGGKQPRRASSTKSSNNGEETDVIGDLVGHFGRWQFVMTMLLSLFQVPNTFHISSSVYQAAHKVFWCKRPSHLEQLPVDVWRNLSNSNDNCFQAHIDWSQVSNESVASMLQQQQRQHGSVVQPLTYPHVYRHPLSMENTTRISCSAWEYETEDNVGNTWTSEWDLVCDKEYLKNVAEMFFLLGVATGGIISGYLSDKFGRKKMLFISAVLQTIFGLALYFANSFELYITLRALLGLVSVSVTYAGLILAIEYVDGKWRTIAGMYNLFPLPISYMLISGIAYLTQDYKRLQLCIGIPGIFLCFLWFVVPESPRWLLVKGRIDEVKRIVEAAATCNKRELPPNFESMLKPPTQEDSSDDFVGLFRSPYLRRISICFLCIWFTMNLVYYGIVLNMSSFGGNVYLNSALAGLVEIPAIAIAMYIISKVGKKWLFCATLICAGIACCCAAITEGQEELLWLKITFLMIGKFTISAGNTIMPVYTAELYPTAIRNAGVGACNVAAGLALILTPYLSLLTKIESHLLMTLLTAWSLFGGFVVLFLPETMAEHLKKNAPDQQKC